MTPTDLKQYLDVLKGAGLMSVHLKLPGGAEIAATFAPAIDMGQPVSELEPGGFRGPKTLDTEFSGSLPD